MRHRPLLFVSLVEDLRHRVQVFVLARRTAKVEDRCAVL
jgi:hypothetical protein